MMAKLTDAYIYIYASLGHNELTLVASLNITRKYKISWRNLKPESN